MTSPMMRVQFRSIVEPILNEVFDGIYEQRKDEWKKLFDESTGTKRSYHEEPVMYAFGAAPELPDAQPITYGSGGVLFIKRYIYKVFGLGFSLSRTLVEDGDHIRLGSMFSKALAQSLVETKELETANILNRAFNGSFAGGDGVALNANNHPIQGGTFSNVLSTPANLSQTSLEQMLIQIRNTVDNTGKRIRLSPKCLVVSPDNMFQAEVLLNSTLRTGTANNDINPVKSMGMLSEACTITRLTSPTAWWIKTDAPEGLKLLMRRKMDRRVEGDFETDSMRYAATERFATGWTDPRVLFGSAGV
jgi:hypothetical protein